MTACDLEKSFSFRRQLKLQATCGLQFTSKHIIVNMRIFYVLDGGHIGGT